MNLSTVNVLFPALLALTLPLSTNAGENHDSDFAWKRLSELTAQEHGIGARPAGSKQEEKAAKWISKQWQAQSLKVNVQPFPFTLKGQQLTSSNLITEIKGESKKTIIIGAHYDSTGDKFGSLGATDNGSGVAALLTLSHKLQHTKLPYTIRLIAFGAEEFGLKGSKAYVSESKNDLKDVIGMINLDTIIGGDKLYIHSAHTTPYKCTGIQQKDYNSEPNLRDGLKHVSDNIFENETHFFHPEYKGYPKGVTGSWSDHSPFACSGIPIAYIEATNFDINGKSGNDGYSQSTETKLWDCFDSNKNGSCDRKNETSWGEIWHTKYDRLDKLNSLFEGRLSKQLNQNIELLYNFVLTADKSI